jgi:YD repeat-containing protein
LETFKYDASTKTSTNYSYDVNGNMIIDNNKKISAISYNHLNLPNNITVTNKGSIAYTYDAAGNKLKKVTTESSSVTTTMYMFGLLLQKKTLRRNILYGFIKQTYIS